LFRVIVDNEGLLQEVLRYIGPNQYSLIAGINTTFHHQYRHIFPNQTSTAINVSTMALAEYFWRAHLLLSEEGARKQVEYQLSANAAKHGNIEVLQYLQSVQCAWDKRTCAYAARNGHLHVIQWA
jgi:hypothetical protein